MLGSSPPINDTHTSSPNPNSIPEFVKKLFGMLEDNTYPQIFSWGTEGDTFVVKDPNEFARHILPKHFKHSNFASFVRQLNKYDFHKLRMPEDGQRLYGDQAWEFQHPNFKYNRRELLEDIKRKPTGKAAQANLSNAAVSTSTGAKLSPNSITSIEQEIKSLTNVLQKEINSLKDTQKKMTDKIKGFDKKYSAVLDSIQGFKKNMEEQDSLMREIMNFVSKQQNNVNMAGQQDLENIVHTYNNVSSTGQVQLERLYEVGTSATTTAPVLIPSDNSNNNNIQMNNNTSMIPVIHANSPTRKRKRMQPGWSVPPRVLLVDDDSIFRRLSTRLLQVAGCTIDVAVDGVEAVRKLGSGKYDLVLMDIMMPKLDGMSATRNIRQYDTWTPIISMTSNTTDQDIQQYFMSGMTDVLPKPFNQGSLGSLLERYCAHLVVQRQHQQQLQLLQQNYSLNGSLIDLNNMTPQLTLIEENEDTSNNNTKGKGKGLDYLNQQQQQTMYSTPSSNHIIPQLQSNPLQILTDPQQQQQQQQYYLYVNQKRPKIEGNINNTSL